MFIFMFKMQIFFVLVKKNTKKHTHKHSATNENIMGMAQGASVRV